MHWVGGGVKVRKRDNNPYVSCVFYLFARVFCFFSLVLLKSEIYVYINKCTTVIITNKVFLI